MLIVLKSLILCWQVEFFSWNCGVKGSSPSLYSRNFPCFSGNNYFLSKYLIMITNLNVIIWYYSLILLQYNIAIIWEFHTYNVFSSYHLFLLLTSRSIPPSIHFLNLCLLFLFSNSLSPNCATNIFMIWGHSL